MDNLSDSADGSVSGLAELKRKSFIGIGSLIKRQAIVRSLSFLANVALARLLVPEVFGVYAIILFVVQFFSAFGDVGLGAALIQKHGDLTREELSSTFWLQQLLVWTVACAAFFAAPLVLDLYPALPRYGVWLVRAMCASLVLTSLKTIPAILMERKLDFERIALVDIVETAVFYAAAILMALAGFEVWSFITAALLRSFAGTALIYALSDWAPSWRFEYSAVRELVRFGLPYQGNSILGFVKDAVAPLFVGMYCGAAGVGFVNWAKTFAFTPLLLSEAFGRVAFPAFSRIQADRDLLAKAIERSIRSITLIMFPVTCLLISLGPEIIRVLFTEKWLPALWAYYFYCTSPLVIGVVLPMYSAILSLGKSGVILKMTSVLLVLEWGAGVPFVMAFGFNGIAFSQPLIAALFCLVYLRLLAAEGVRIKVLKNIRVAFLSALAAALFSRGIMNSVEISIWTVAACVAAGLLLYVGSVYLLEKSALVEFKENLVKIAGVSGKA